MNLKKAFAEKLKEIRKSKGLTQEQLAELVNVAPRHISFIETARSFPSCDLLERLCKVLNIDYSILFDYDDDMTREEIIEHIFKTIENLDDKKLKYIYKMVSAI